MNTNDAWDEETRRRDASVLLKSYIDQNLSDERVLVVGDLNDILTDNASNNVFQTFLDDNTHYSFLDMSIAEGNSNFWSYPTWPSHLDHILMTNEVFGDIQDLSSNVQTLSIDESLNGGWGEYDNNVSDHRPVGVRLLPSTNVGIEDTRANDWTFSVYPNPANGLVKFALVPSNAKRQLTLINTMGEELLSREIPAMSNEVLWDASTLPQGIYTIIVSDLKGKTASQKLAIHR